MGNQRDLPMLVGRATRMDNFRTSPGDGMPSRPSAASRCVAASEITQPTRPGHGKALRASDTATERHPLQWDAPTRRGLHLKAWSRVDGWAEVGLGGGWVGLGWVVAKVGWLLGLGGG